jgi:hypothetical protein
MTSRLPLAVAILAVSGCVGTARAQETAPPPSTPAKRVCDEFSAGALRGSRVTSDSFTAGGVGTLSSRDAKACAGGSPRRKPYPARAA